MEPHVDIDISIREGGDRGSRSKIATTPLKRKLRKEKKYIDKDPLLTKFRRPCNHNGKSYMCNKVRMSDIKLIREKFFSIPEKTAQDIKLCHVISVCSVIRNRPVSNEPKNRCINVTYHLKTRENKQIRVCQKFVCLVLSITKNRINTVAKTIHEGNVPKENRGGDKTSHKSVCKKGNIREFIGELRGTESHYNRSKSQRIYLSATLSIAKLCKIYNTNNEEKYKCSLSMFSRIFCKEFNIGFSSPAADCCSLCTRLKHTIQIEKDTQKKLGFITELQIHKKRANAFYQLARENPPNSITFCFHMQQVQPLPRTPISDAFYSHQVSFYVFCCVGMNSKCPTFYTWTEDLAGRGSVEISSALVTHLDSLDYKDIKVVRLFCDGCGGQNKNSHVIHALYYWLKVKSPPGLQEIQVTYPVRGHSFLPADRAFGRVEKTLRKNTTLIKKEDYVKIYSEFGNVRQLGEDWKLYDIKSLQDNLKKVEGISDYKRIFIQKGKKNKGMNTIKVQCHQNFNFLSLNETPQNLLKRGKMDPKEVKEIQLGRPLPEKKKKIIRHLMQQQFGSKWEEDQNLNWYKELLLSEGVDEPMDTDEQCDCLEDDLGVHI